MIIVNDLDSICEWSNDLFLDMQVHKNISTVLFLDMDIGAWRALLGLLCALPEFDIA